MKGPDVFAHRGLSSKFPENTLLAFKKALELGTDGIELDVQMTKDKRIVVIHDETLKRTTNGYGFVKDYAYNELKSLDAGSWFSKRYSGEKIPLLEDVLNLVKNTNTILNIELKNSIIKYEGIEKEVLRLIKKFNIPDVVIISSFNHSSLKTVNELDSSVETAVLSSKKIYNPIEYLKEIGANSLHTNMNSITSSLVNILKKNNIKLRCYTINKKRNFIYLAKLGVDGIFTDKADEMIELKKKIKL